MSKKPKSQLKPNAIVVCCTPSWLPAAACTLKSCADQGGAEVADFYVIAMGLTANDRSNFQAFLAKHKMKATLIEGVLPQNILSKAPKRYSAATFLRLTMNLQIDPNYKRVMYLDSDVLALAPMAQVFTSELNGKPLGAVEDYLSFPDWRGKHARHPKSIGLQSDAPYFNAGVLLFDWNLVLQHGLLNRCTQLILDTYAKGGKFKFNDQDALNIVFEGQWQRMDTRFNLISIVSDYFPEAPVLRHFTMDHKPWHHVKGIGYEKYRSMYKSMLDGTPWMNFTSNGLAKIAPLHAIGKFFRSRDGQMRARYREHLER